MTYHPLPALFIDTGISNARFVVPAYVSIATTLPQTRQVRTYYLNFKLYVRGLYVSCRHQSAQQSSYCGRQQEQI